MFEWNNEMEDLPQIGDDPRRFKTGPPTTATIDIGFYTTTRHADLAHPYGPVTEDSKRQPLTASVNFDDIYIPKHEQEPSHDVVNWSVLNESVADGGSTNYSPSRSPIKVDATHYNPDSSNPDHNGKDLYFPLEDVDVQSFHNDLPLSPRRHTSMTLHSNHGNNRDTSTIHGKKIQVNGKELALFCYKDKFYAVNEKCPHLGGPLHLGDIEDLPGSDSPHIVCPWHKWKFDLSTGRRVRPTGGRDHHKNIESYPVRTDYSGKICIGFESIDPSCFDVRNF